MKASDVSPEVSDRLADFRWSTERLWPQFERKLRESPEALALVDAEERSWSRRQIADLAASVSVMLGDAGIGRGRRVLFPAERSAQTLAAALAISQCEAVCCPYAPILNEADFARIGGVLGHAAHLRFEAEDAFALDIEPRGRWSTDKRDHEAALIAFTSGSTGAPKAVIHRSEALNYVTTACATIAALEPDDPILGAIPMDGAAGFAFTVHMALSSGRPLVLTGRWDPHAVLERAARFGCAWTTLVPTQLFTLLEAARADGAWRDRLVLRTIAVGGSSMTPELIADAETFLGVVALRMFGMSECLAHCSNQPSFPREVRLLADGRAFPGSEIATLDADGRRLEPGERGQAGVKGPSLFVGYAAGLGGGQEQLTAEGFYLTGDEIVVDRDGFVRVVGRIKDQIIRGGYNIDPAEIEAILLRHPSVAQAAVVPTPHDKLGEQACAVCRLHPDAAFSMNDLLTHFNEAGVYKRKWPEHLVIVDAMRTLPSGKIDKRVMTDLAVAEVIARG
jgi:acyl-CoA synthetase (AMP-forming)/AMP-acid ligase II